MHRRIDLVATEATILALVTAALLILAGALDVGGSVWLVGALLALTVLLLVARDRFPSVGWVLSHDVDSYLDDLWVVPAVAALVVVVNYGASPGEVTALGGLVGLLGMANYFLRPVYHLGYSIAATVASFGRRGDRSDW